MQRRLFLVVPNRNWDPIGLIVLTHASPCSSVHADVGRSHTSNSERRSFGAPPLCCASRSTKPQAPSPPPFLPSYALRIPVQRGFCFVRRETFSSPTNHARDFVPITARHEDHPGTGRGRCVFACVRCNQAVAAQPDRLRVVVAGALCPALTLQHLVAQSMCNTQQVGGRPLSAVTPEKHAPTPSSRAMKEDENAELLREAGDMSPDLTMKSIVEVSVARSASYNTRRGFRSTA